MIAIILQRRQLLNVKGIDELQTFVGNKKNKVWIWSGAYAPVPSGAWSDAIRHRVNHWKPGILLWTVGGSSSTSFQIIWSIIRCWQSFWYVTRTHPRSVPLLRKGQVRSTAMESLSRIY